MNPRLFDHIDLRVTNLAAADAFYRVILPPLGFPTRVVEPHCISYDSRCDHPKPPFIALVENPAHAPNQTRLAFWCDTNAEVDAFGRVLSQAPAKNVEGPMACPEYGPSYYAVFFEDPCGNRLEVCCRGTA